MNKNELKLLAWLTRYGFIASRYKAWLDKKSVKPKGEPFKTTLASLVTAEG